ncbi:GNAT family acetyltransferase [candidate division KSB1 bacterium]|nr:GNAT family acetyltransferase [candidate division KSB1 bacterium]
MRIRPYHHQDEQEVIQLWRDCDLIVPQNDPYKDIQRKTRMNPELFLIGIKDGKIIASCMIGYEGHRGWINYLAVAPAYRHQGYASQLMHYAEEVLKKLGCPKINVQVRATDTEVIEFYKNIGYLDDEVVSLGKRLIED